MKRTVTFIILLLTATSLFAQQMPIGINYQAVARDNQGNELKNRNLNIRLSIISGDLTGPVEYSETHSIVTDNFGLFKLVIGAGAYYAGEKTEFTDIDWSTAPHFLKVESDFGQGFVLMGTMQFLAVPYALYAATAGNTAGEEDRDKDPENELQVLSLEGQVLRISKGNAITLSDIVNDADADPENERQDLQLDQNNKLKITNNPNASVIDLNPFLDNTDNQTLSSSGNSIKISNGNSIPADMDSTNELQDISLNGYNLSLSQGSTVNLKPVVIAFRAIKPSSSSILTAGDSIWLSFNAPQLNIGSGFNNSDGKFTVPTGGEGLYAFNITYDYNSSAQSLRIFKNNVKVETLFEGFNMSSGPLSHEFIIYLNDGDYLQISLKSTSTTIIGAAVLSGYRIH
jgi:hypothetical protein